MERELEEIRYILKELKQLQEIYIMNTTDLTNAVAALQTVATNLNTYITGLQNAPDPDAPAIEAAVTAINSIATSLQALIPVTPAA